MIDKVKKLAKIRLPVARYDATTHHKGSKKLKSNTLYIITHKKYVLPFEWQFGNQ